MLRFPRISSRESISFASIPYCQLEKSIFFDPWEVVHGQNKLQLEIQKWNQKQRRNWGCIREKLSVLTSSKSKSKDYLRIKVKRDLRLVLSFLRRHQNANESDQREDGEKEKEREMERERKRENEKHVRACMLAYIHVTSWPVGPTLNHRVTARLTKYLDEQL